MFEKNRMPGFFSSGFLTIISYFFAGNAKFRSAFKTLAGQGVGVFGV